MAFARLSLSCLSLFLLILFSFSLSRGAEEGAPAGELYLEETSHNFGVVREGTPIHYQFILKNVGRGDLKIIRIAPGCCSEVTLSKDALGTGETALLDVKLPTHDREGLLLQTIYIHTDSPVTTLDYVRLFGLVKKASSASP